MMSRIVNDVIIIRTLPKNYSGVTKKSIVKNWNFYSSLIVLHGSVVV